MRTYLDCVPCFVRQALDAARLATNEPRIHEQILRATLQMAADMDMDQSPPRIGREIHRRLRELTGDIDPYRTVKQHSNELALHLYPRLQQEVEQSDDPFNTALRLAIAGNIIDFGCKSQVSEDDVHESLEQAADAVINEGAVEDLKTSAESAGNILYLADNAGEIVLDRLLIERLPTKKVTVAVKGAPVINDAVREDAEAARLSEIAEVIDNGCDAPGTILEVCSPEFQQRFHQADLVISKGQGNYETLSDLDREIFFLLKAKCPVIARHIECEVGKMVVHHHKGVKRA